MTFSWCGWEVMSQTVLGHAWKKASNATRSLAMSSEFSTKSINLPGCRRFSEQLVVEDIEFGPSSHGCDCTYRPTRRSTPFHVISSLVLVKRESDHIGPPSKWDRRPDPPVNLVQQANEHIPVISILPKPSATTSTNAILQRLCMQQRFGLMRNLPQPHTERANVKTIVIPRTAGATPKNSRLFLSMSICDSIVCLSGPL